MSEGSTCTKDHLEKMSLAISEAEKARFISPPNPWVGAVLDTGDGLFYGHTQSPGQGHAETQALARAGKSSIGSTLYVTLEPCSHQGKTPPCVNAIVEAGVKRVVIGLVDPDRRVRGTGIAYLKSHGIEVIENFKADEVKAQLAPYLKQRATGLPWVVLKLAVTLDGRIAARDGSSNWITGEAARHRVQLLRAQSDVVVVGANTIREDDPLLTVRLPGVSRTPVRVVLGRIPPDARVLPAEEFLGTPIELLTHYGRKDVLQVLVEGGAQVAKSFFMGDLIDQYVFHIAPALFGGDDGVSAFSGAGAEKIDDISRLNLRSVTTLGSDVEIVAWSQRASRLIQGL